MPFLPHVVNVSIFPHVFSRLDPPTKAAYRKRYKQIKHTGSATAIASVGLTEGAQLAKDVMSSKLKAYGYKSLFAIAIGPIIQFVSLPLYVFSYGSKFRRIAVATTEIGAKISKGEMGVVNWAWIAADMILFGEPIPITDESDYMLIHNETVGSLTDIIETIGDRDD